MCARALVHVLPTCLLASECGTGPRGCESCVQVRVTDTEDLLASSSGSDGDEDIFDGVDAFEDVRARGCGGRGGTHTQPLRASL